ncbi:MAG: ArsR/SmtB family transcription factor [Christensenellales bacterium]|jgi:ArsR family transcriptional regulator
MNLSSVFKALGDDTRLRILGLLRDRELCVCEIGQTLEIQQPNISKHLNKLRYAGIIQCRKISQWCFFRLSDTFIAERAVLYNFLAGEWARGRQYREDLKKLREVIESNICCQQILKDREIKTQDSAGLERRDS